MDLFLRLDRFEHRPVWGTFDKFSFKLPISVGMGRELLHQHPIEEDICKEIEIAEKKGLTLSTFLNNFYSNFPGQFYRKFFSSIPDQNGVPFIKIPFSQIVGEINLNSQKLYASTYEDFFSEINDVLNEIDLDLDFLKNYPKIEKQINWR